MPSFPISGLLLALIPLLWLLRARARAQQALEQAVLKYTALEAVLAANKADLARLYDAAPCGYLSLDATGLIQRVNGTALGWLGQDAEALVGQLRLPDLLVPEARQRWHQALDELAPDAELGPLDAFLPARRPPGRWVRITATAERDADGTLRVLHVVLFDITRQREAERALQQVNAQQRAIIDSDLLGIARIRNQTLIWVSSGMTRVFGYPRDDLTGMPTRTLYAFEQDYLEIGAAAYAGFRADGRFRGEIAALHADGRQLWVEARAITFDPNGDETLWLFTDISARRQAEAALRASQSFLARTGAVAGVGGFEIDVLTERVQWSDETCRLHDVVPGSTLTLDVFLEFHAPEGRAVIEQAVREATDFGAPWDLELPMVAASGRRFWARTVGTVEAEHGRVVRLVGALQDITARRRMEQELSASRELLQVTLASIGDAVITTDTVGCVNWLNPVAETLTGWDREAAQGKPLGLVYRAIEEGDRSPLADPVARTLREGKIVGLARNTLLVARGRREHAVEDSIAPIRNEDGDAIGTVLVFRDVSEQRRMAREVTYRATHDALTDLANRADFESRLAGLLAERKQAGSGEVGAGDAVMYIDLDQFKLLNDNCGHLVGDQILRQIAAMFRFSVRQDELVARLGGDEFGVILRQRTLEQARRLGEQMCTDMEGYRFHFEGRRFRVGASIGLVPLDGRWRDVNALLDAADQACYAAKEAGRNRVHQWRESERNHARNRVVRSWSTRLEQALEDDAFVLHAQRVQTLVDGGPALGWEVLLRLRDEFGNLSFPGGFLPPAERFHLLARIDRWVVCEVIRLLERGEGPWGVDGRVSLNLSVQTIGDVTFREDIGNWLAAAPKAARRLCFEMSEEAVLTDLEAARALAVVLHGAGSRIAIDDFAGATAAFGYLRNFPVDLVKIDRLLCACLPGTALDRAVLRGSLEVARVLGVPAVAKGIETDAQDAAVRALGVTHAQGYRYGGPQPLASLVAMPDNRTAGMVLPSA